MSRQAGHAIRRQVETIGTLALGDGTGRRRVIGACPHDCPDTCSLVTDVDAAGTAVRVRGNPDHGQTDGVLCTKVARYTERTYHPDRLLHPLKRVGPKGAGQFEPVSWEQAISEIGSRLSAIAERDPQAVLPYSYAGTMGRVQGEGMASRFFNRLGASRLERTICSIAGGVALDHTLGTRDGMRVEHFAESGLILIWGSNPITSSVHFWRLAQQAKRAGARLVCIDPRRSETAERCHDHLALRPGTDAALALAIMHQLIVNDWLDHDYIARYTLGWETLRERALTWTPARAAEVCRVPAVQIIELARAYGTISPAAIRLNYGMQRTRGGGNAVRAVACLPALVGAWRHRAGGLLLSSSSAAPYQRAALERPDLRNATPSRSINMVTIGDDLLRETSPDFGPRIEALVVFNSNPVAVAPDSGKVVRGFAREDLFTVVLEHFQTDTADYADYVLPATTQLEHWDVHSSYGHTDVLLNRPAIAPCGEALSNSEIFRRLAKAMGFTDRCFDEDDLTLCRQAFGDAVDFDALLERGHVTLELPEAPFADGRFPTPSGRCEFRSAALAEQGMDPVPDYLPNHEPVGSDQRYPLAFISPPARNFMNSTFANVDALMALEDQPLLEMHPLDAIARGLSDGARVRTFNARGEYLCRLCVTLRARPGVVNGLGIWWRKQGMNGTNVNELTSQNLTDLGGGAAFYDCLVEVEAAPGQH